MCPWVMAIMTGVIPVGPGLSMLAPFLRSVRHSSRSPVLRGEKCLTHTHTHTHFRIKLEQNWNEKTIANTHPRLIVECNSTSS